MNARSEYLNKGLTRLKEEQTRGYQICLENISKWRKFREDYEQLKSKLETLADKLNYDIMVPFGSVAFMPGKLIHSNEIMVLLGDNWFVERSAKQATEIVMRRIAQCDNSLVQFEKERKQFEQWMLSTKQVQEEIEGELLDIVEEFDEGKEQAWKEKHRQNMKKYHQKKSSSLGKEAEAEAEADYWNKLEIIESVNNEMSDAESNAIIENSSKESDISSSDEEETESEASSSNDESRKQTQTQTRKSVQWKEAIRDSCPEATISVPTVKIKFTETSDPSASKIESSSTMDVPTIQSPSDIYKYFSTESEPLPLKSILKSSSNRNIPVDAPVVLPPPDSSKQTVLPKFVEETENKAFPGLIVERQSQTSIQASQDVPTRRISKFKERQMQMKKT